MFSKALFKQSCKANGMTWSIITFTVCFMLACVMLISGNGNIGEVKNAIQDTIITKEIDAQMEKRALFYYDNAQDGLTKFDSLFMENARDNLSYLTWLSQMPEQSSFTNQNEYYLALSNWQEKKPDLNTTCGEQYVIAISEWQATMPSINDYESIDDYYYDLNAWNENTPLSSESAIKMAYTNACNDLQGYILQKAVKQGYLENSIEAQEMLGSVMYVLNPNGMFDTFYLDNNEEIPLEYDVLSIVNHLMANDIEQYLLSEERISYILDRAQNGAAIFLAGNMLKEENIEVLMKALSIYGVNQEKYESFGYSYDSIKHLAQKAMVTYQGQVDYELSMIQKDDYASEEAYLIAINAKKEALAQEISSSFLSTLPSTVSDALEEVGKADLYTLIVGSIFYKLAGLLLPIIYMIMASNNLIAGQVDSGSMAYVLSTSTKRREIVFTQAVYLIGSLLAMFSLTTITGCVCLALISEEVGLTYGKLILLNVGAFLVLLALSGLCFLTSCVFDRSKRSMAIGGGLSIFALVAAMLGLFGSPVIPSVVRLNALNYFNYVTIISLFDVISIIDGTSVFVWKFIILAIMGVIGYVLGSKRFIKKDLPL